MHTLRCFTLGLTLLAGCSSTGSTQSDGATGTDGSATTPDVVTTTPDASHGTDAGSSGTVTTYGQTYSGGEFHLGPVDYAETQWHNACAPGTRYDARVQSVEGSLLAGLWNGIPNVEDYCDACIYVTTGQGHSALLRVVTYGDTTANSIDVSPEAYAILNAGENPRSMTWQFAECADSGPMLYEFQTGANEWWTSLWVRNARVPLARVEVQSANHPGYIELTRAGDGTLTDASGFGQGTFSIRSTGVDGQVVVETFAWPGNGIAGAFLTGTQNFR